MGIFGKKKEENNNNDENKREEKVSNSTTFTDFKDTAVMIMNIISNIPFKVGTEFKDPIIFNEDGLKMMCEMVYKFMQLGDSKMGYAMLMIDVVTETCSFPVISFLRNDKRLATAVGNHDISDKTECEELIDEFYSWMASEYYNRGVNPYLFFWLVDNHYKIMDGDSYNNECNYIIENIHDKDIRCGVEIPTELQMKEAMLITKKNIEKEMGFKTDEEEEITSNNIVKEEIEEEVKTDKKSSSKLTSTIYNASKDTPITFIDQLSNKIKDDLLYSLISYPYSVTPDVGFPEISNALKEFLDRPYYQYKINSSFDVSGYCINNILHNPSSIIVYIIDDCTTISEMVCAYLREADDEDDKPYWFVDKYTDDVINNEKLSEMFIEKSNIGKLKKNGSVMVFANMDHTITIDLSEFIKVFKSKDPTYISSIDKIYFALNILNVAIQKFMAEYAKNHTYNLFEEDKPVKSIIDYESIKNDKSRTSKMIDIFDELYSEGYLNNTDIDCIRDMNNKYLSLENLDSITSDKESNLYRIGYKDRVCAYDPSTKEFSYVHKFDYLFKNEFPFIISKDNVNIFEVHHIESESLQEFVKFTNNVLGYISYEHSENE